MVAALEDSIATAAHQQVQDMLNNAIVDPEKFRNLSLRTKAPNVGKDIKKTTLIVKGCFCLLMTSILLLFGLRDAF